jgi:uncharacterized protein with PIN domain
LRYSFVAESTLGKLARLLRLAGFDTLLQTGVPDPLILADMARSKRWILTRTRRVYACLATHRAILIMVNDPQDQLRGLFSRLAIQRQELKPLTRCTLCNHALVGAPPGELAAQVPDYVGRHHRVLRRCPGCLRIYWPGSHVSGMMARLNHWFD